MLSGRIIPQGRTAPPPPPADFSGNPQGHFAPHRGRYHPNPHTPTPRRTREDEPRPCVPPRLYDPAPTPAHARPVPHTSRAPPAPGAVHPAASNRRGRSARPAAAVCGCLRALAGVFDSSCVPLPCWRHEARTLSACTLRPIRRDDHRAGPYPASPDNQPARTTSRRRTGPDSAGDRRKGDHLQGRKEATGRAGAQTVETDARNLRRAPAPSYAPCARSSPNGWQSHRDPKKLFDGYAQTGRVIL